MCHDERKLRHNDSLSSDIKLDGNSRNKTNQLLGGADPDTYMPGSDERRGFQSPVSKSSQHVNQK